MRLRRLLCSMAALFAGSAGSCWAQAPGEAAEAGRLAGVESVDNARHAEVQRVAESLNFVRDVSGGTQAVEIVSQPVLRYTDEPRTDRDGGVWVVGKEGKPLGMMVVYTKASFPRGRWIQAVTSLCPENSLRGTNEDRVNWRPASAAVVMKPIPSAPQPAAEPADRLRQIKALARRFTGHEFWPANSRHELRLLVQPLYRYQESETGILDGAIFALAHDTNPETFVIIEAVENEAGAQWKYGIARFGFAELHVALDSEEVWTKNILSSTSPREPYWLFHLQF